MATPTLMFKTRPCGCKGLRSCKICEQNYGAWNLQENVDIPKECSFVFCPHCKSLFPGWEIDDCTGHSTHKENTVSFSGIELILDFISESEEKDLLQKLDEVPWDPSQSGRYKQNYGPKCNFKKRKVRDAEFTGYPHFTKFIQDRFKNTRLLTNFQTVEQCSLDYTVDRGSSIDPHIDDCWIWGERIPTLSLLSDSFLTLTKFKGPGTKYNLNCTLEYPRVVDSNGSVKDLQTMKEQALDILSQKPDNDTNSNTNKCQDQEDNSLPDLIRVPMPRRSLLILYGDARYDYEHSISRDDIIQRRVCITYRELTPPFLESGDQEHIGKKILQSSSKFWSHKDREES